MLTASEKKRLAKEARRLGLEFAIGEQLTIRNDSWGHCAAGRLLEAADMLPEHGARGLIAAYLDDLLGMAFLTEATDRAVAAGNDFPAAIPLLALADELDPAPPKVATPNTREGE